MTTDQYQRYKESLEAQLRAGIELLQAAYRQQMKALDLVWAAGVGEMPAVPGAAGPLPPSRQEAPSRPRRRAWGLYDEVVDVLANVPEVFHRGHVCEQLGYQPDRGSLYRTFQEMVSEGLLTIQSLGESRRPTLYRKTGGALQPAEA